MNSKHMMSYVLIPIDEPIEQNADEEDEKDEEDEEDEDYEDDEDSTYIVTINQNAEEEGW
jgi:hypothetical protein